MKTVQKVNLTSPQLTEKELSELHRLFPEIFTEKKIDWDKFKAILDSKIEHSPEKFNFTWVGKLEAIKNVFIPSKLSLKPIKEESINFEESENIFIEGDNLEVLKLLQSGYFGKIKIIYIDPPYNTGSDFVYHDNYFEPLNNYLSQTGQIDENGIKLSVNLETNGRFHSVWLSMMYPRLKLAWNLLTDDGVIFISIDDNELHHLKMMMDEIFGEENFRNIFTLRRYDKNINRQFIEKGLKSFNIGYEYILCYSKSSDFKFNPVYRKCSEKRENYGYWKGFWNDANRPTMRYKLLGVSIKEGQWKWSQYRAEKAVNNYVEYIKKYSKKMSIEEYWHLTGKEKEFIRIQDGGKGKNKGVEHWVPPSEGILRNTNWTDLLISKDDKELNIPFDSPKSKEVIANLIQCAQNNGDIVLDFFAGSGVTAQAVLELNKNDNGNRKFILVQLPEPTNKNSEARKSG